MLQPSEILQPKTRALEIPQDFFLITTGNSTLFLINLWKFHLLFLQYPWKFHILNPLSFCCLAFFWNNPFTASWLAIFVSAEPSRAVLSIDRSEPRFESLAGGKIRIIKKNNKNFDIFCKFLINQIQNIFGQIKEMKDGIFKRITTAERYDDARDKNVPPPLVLTWILKSYHKRNNRSKFQEK